MKRFLKQEKLLSKFAKTDFETRLLKAAFVNLQDTTNELHFNNFAYSIRELSRHILERLSPDKNIISSPWYTNEIPNKKNGITRAQRVKYAVQGGLTDQFVLKRLNVDLQKPTKRLLKVVDELNKHTHVIQSTFGIPQKKVREFVNETANAFENLFKTIHDCRSKVVHRIEDKIDSTLIEHILETTFDEVDMLSTQSSIQDVFVDNIVIDEITDKDIIILATGKVRTRLQYGSDLDLRNDDGYVSHDSFPFESRLSGRVNQLKHFEPEIESTQIDTKSFYE
jgi:hypothetical protein